MKKIIAVLTVLMCLATTSVFAQEVRGVETKRVMYEGGETYEYTSDYSWDFSSTKYYGWEFKNLNSCAVSVDITLYKQDSPARVISTKSIVLQSGETYIFKKEIYDTRAIRDFGHTNNKEIEYYYVEYKAFKLQ